MAPNSGASSRSFCTRIIDLSAAVSTAAVLTLQVSPMDANVTDRQMARARMSAPLGAGLGVGAEFIGPSSNG